MTTQTQEPPVFLCACPACHGTGKILDLICCGMGGTHGCCGSPDEVEVTCQHCEGQLTVNLSSFYDYAIRTRNRALLAQYESMVLLQNLKNHPSLQSFSFGSPRDDSESGDDIMVTDAPLKKIKRL